MKRIFILLISLLLILILIYLPLKMAVKDTSLYDSYILVKIEKSTGIRWIIIGDESGNGSIQNIELLGNIPAKKLNYNVTSQDNTYLCTGEYVGISTDVYGNLISQYNVNEWKIIYPINRNTLLSIIHPIRYLTILDYIGQR